MAGRGPAGRGGREAGGGPDRRHPHGDARRAGRSGGPTGGWSWSTGAALRCRRAAPVVRPARRTGSATAASSRPPTGRCASTPGPTAPTRGARPRRSPRCSGWNAAPDSAGAAPRSRVVPPADRGPAAGAVRAGGHRERSTLPPGDVHAAHDQRRRRARVGGRRAGDRRLDAARVGRWIMRRSRPGDTSCAVQYVQVDGWVELRLDIVRGAERSRSARRGRTDAQVRGERCWVRRSGEG